MRRDHALEEKPCLLQLIMKESVAVTERIMRDCSNASLQVTVACVSLEQHGKGCTAATTRGEVIVSLANFAQSAFGFL